MVLCVHPHGLAAFPLCKPLNPKHAGRIATSPLRFRPKNLGLGRLGGRILRATASEEEGSTAVVKDGAETKRIAVPSFLFGTSGDQNSDDDDDVREEGESLLSKINLKVDSEATSTYLIYGASALTVLWISSVIVSAVDSIPVFPKLMEVVGLGYAAWFTYRYLIFKDNREELLTKLADLKKQVIGSDDD